jgi:hypothetical protein
MLQFVLTGSNACATKGGGASLLPMILRLSASADTTINYTVWLDSQDA